jgi:hypothetical protein
MASALFPYLIIFIYAPIYCKIKIMIVQNVLLLHGLNRPEECLMESLSTEMSNGGVT